LSPLDVVVKTGRQLRNGARRLASVSRSGCSPERDEGLFRGNGFLLRSPLRAAAETIWQARWPGPAA
jgi:hypothetical protein